MAITVETLKELRKLLKDVANTREPLLREEAKAKLIKAIEDPSSPLGKAWEETAGNTLSRNKDEQLFKRLLAKPLASPKPKVAAPQLKMDNKQTKTIYEMNELYKQTSAENEKTKYQQQVQEKLSKMLLQNPKVAVAFLGEKFQNDNTKKVNAVVKALSSFVQNDARMKQDLNDMLMGLKANYAGATMLGSTGQALTGDLQSLTGEIGHKTVDQSTFKLDRQNDQQLNIEQSEEAEKENETLNTLLKTSVETIERRIKDLEPPRAIPD